MHDENTPLDQASDVINSARAAEHALQHLCQTTLRRPNMTPAEVDIVLAHLADAAAALPQAARQLGDILARAKEDHLLEMDNLIEIADPDLAIGAARLQLDSAGEAALGLYRLLDAAHNETAHIAVADHTAKHTQEHASDNTPLAPRPENR
jgi:hypothetical protein